MSLEEQKLFQKNIITISGITGRYQREIFADNVSMMAYAIANSVEPNKEKWQQRENEYLKIVKKYKKEHVDLLCQNFAHLVNGLQKKVTDFLGGIYENLQINNRNAGQFFTPFHVSELMANISISDEELKKVGESDDVITIGDPTCGAGNLFLGAIYNIDKLLVEPHQKAKIQRNIIFIGQDIDLSCVHMSYVQCSMLGYSGIFQHMDTIAQKCWDTYYTPSYFVFASEIRLRNKIRRDKENNIKTELMQMLNSEIFLKLGA